MLTNSLVAVCDALVEMLNDTKDQTGLQAVYYGDQEQIETTPIACIEGESKVFTPRQMAQGRMQDIEFTVGVIVYHSSIQSVTVTKRESDLFTEAVENVLNSDFTLARGGADPLVIQCWSLGYTPGYSNKGATRMRVSKINFWAKSQFLLPG